MIRLSSSSPMIRRGTIFHAYLLYIALTSMLLASSAICLKLLLQTGQSTNAGLLLMNQLEDVQRQLRQDFKEAALVGLSDGELQLKPEVGDIRWSIQESELTRRLSDVPDETISVYRFDDRHRLAWERDSDLVTLNITEGLIGEIKDLPRSQHIARSSIELTFHAEELP